MRQTPTGRRGVAWLAFIATLAAYALATGDAHAIAGQAAIGPAGPGVIVRTANSAQFVYGGQAVADITRAYGLTGGGGITATDTFPVSSVPGQPAVAVTRSATRAAVMAAGARALQTLPIVAAGVAIWDIYDSMRVRPDGAGGLKSDSGAAPTSEDAVCWHRHGSNECYSSHTALCATGNAEAASTGGTVTKHTQDMNGGTCKWETPQGFDRLQFGTVRTVTAVAVCPASIDFENPAYSISQGQYAPGADGKCPRARSYWQPTTPDLVATRAADFPSVQVTPEVVRDIVERGAPIDTDSAPSVSGPASKPGTPATTTTTAPDGSTTTTTQNTTNNYTYEGDTITWNISNTTSTTNAGGTTSTTTTGQEVQVCGLPGKPACRMDETGTPEAPKVDGTFWDSTFAGLRDLAANPTAALPSLPNISWSFQLPTGCAVIPLPAFAPFLPSIDVCQFQSMFHELMTIVWLLGALFGAINMFFRNALAYN